jgi:GNAT superfamily N-acetyltransferase
VGITIRRLTSDDLEPADALLSAAYGRADPWGSELARCLDLEPAGWFAAAVGGELAGTGGAVNYGPFAWIGLMGVHPSRQRHGIGKTILNTILSWLEMVECPIAVLDASAAGAPLYSGSGFIDDGTTSLFQRHAEPTRSQHDGVTRVRKGDLDELSAFDSPYFGADRRRVLARFFADDPERALLVRDEDGRIRGYLFAQRQRLGPWVASTTDVAEALLMAGLSLDFDGPAIVLAPSQNDDVGVLLDRYGFREQRSLRHMYKGPQPARQRRRCIYGQASFGIG